MQENNHFGAILYQAPAQKHTEKKNTKTKKNDKKNTFLHSGKPPPYFC